MHFQLYVSQEDDRYVHIILVSYSTLTLLWWKKQWTKWSKGSMLRWIMSHRYHWMTATKMWPSKFQQHNYFKTSFSHMICIATVHWFLLGLLLSYPTATPYAMASSDCIKAQQRRLCTRRLHHVHLRDVCSPTQPSQPAESAFSTERHTCICKATSVLRGTHLDI